MKKIILTIVMMATLSILVGCGATFTPDYTNEVEFESALNNGVAMEGKTAEITIRDIKPNSLFGFNIIAGEHLNFVSQNNPNKEISESMTVKVTEVKSMLGSYVIYYELIK